MYSITIKDAVQLYDSASSPLYIDAWDRRWYCVVCGDKEFQI